MVFFSQRVLLELTTAGFSREEAYKIVQKNAMKAWKKKLLFLQENVVSNKKLPVKYLLIKLKSYLISVIILKKLI